MGYLCSLILLIGSIDGHLNPIEWRLDPTQLRDLAATDTHQYERGRRGEGENHYTSLW